MSSADTGASLPTALPTDGSGVDVLDTGAAGGKAIRGGALRSASYFLAMLFSLASVPFMTRHLGPANYGYFLTVSSIVFILGGITEAGLTNLGMREYAVRGGADRDAYLRHLVGLRLVLTVGGVLLAVALTAVTGAPRVVVEGTLVAGVGLLLTMTQQTYMVSLSAQLRLGWVSGLELIRQATISASMIALVVAGASLLPFFFTSVLGGLVMLACTLLVLRSDAGLAPAVDVGEWKRILRDVLPYALAAAVGLIYFRLAIILTSYIGTEHETGIYGAAYRIVETVAVIPWIVVSSGFPILARAARDDEQRLRYALQRLFDVSALLGVWVSLSLAVGAKFAIDVVAGSAYADSVGVLRLQALSLITAFLVATWSFALLSLKRYRQLLVANAIAALTALALTLALIPPLGASGAALATLGAEMTLAAGYLVQLARTDRSLVPSFGVVSRILPGAGAMVAIGALVPAHPVLLVVLGSAAYWALAVALRAVPPELAHAVLRRDPGSVDVARQ
jgi:O-antigen/teichoic acid export membrane protein